MAVNLYRLFSTEVNARIMKLSPRQSNKIPFLIDNAVEDDTIAKYSLICAIQWDEHPQVFTTFKGFAALGDVCLTAV